MSLPMARRCFLQGAAGLGACVVAGCGGSSGGESAAPPDEVSVPLSAIPLGGVIATSAGGCGAERGALVGRDDAGVYAYTNVCTHQGGLVPAPDEMGVSRCCLHGSQFDVQGNLLKGITPGQADLRHHVVRLEGSGPDAMVVIDLASTQADRSVRVPAA